MAGQQHLRHGAALPVLRARVVRVFQQAVARSSPRSAISPPPITPGSSRTQASSSASAASSPPESTKSPRRDLVELARLDHALVDALVAAAEQRRRRARRRGRARSAWSSAGRAASGRSAARPGRAVDARRRAPHRPRPAASPCRRRRRTACRPRCGGGRCAKPRMSIASSDQRPSRSALPGERLAERPGEHLREQREDGGAPGRSSRRPPPMPSCRGPFMPPSLPVRRQPRHRSLRRLDTTRPAAIVHHRHAPRW